MAEVFAKFHDLFADVEEEAITLPSTLEFDCMDGFFLQIKLHSKAGLDGVCADFLGRET